MNTSTPIKGTPFFALLWKELHEGLRWGIIGIIAVSLVLLAAMALSSVASSMMAQGPPSASLLITALLVGSMIGLAQAIPESRGDRFAFLTHRPVSRSMIFAAKASAGTLIYLAATGIPFLWMMIWLSIPGHWPMPFDIRLAEPGIVDILCGLAFYAAGLLAGMRDARWFASRALGFGAAIVCVTTVVLVSDFWMAVAIVLIAIILVGTAAWGALVSGAQYESQARASRLALGMSLLPGIVIAAYIAAMITTFLTPSTRQRITEPSWTSYMLATDGSIVQATSVFRPFHPGPPLISAVKDLSGRPLRQFGDSVTSEQLEKGVDATEQLTLNPGGDQLGIGAYRDINRLFVRIFPANMGAGFGFAGSGAFGEEQDVGIEMSTPSLGVGVPTFGPTEILWYFVRRTGLIEGYDPQIARRIGWLGPNGFTAEAAGPPHGFNGRLRPTGRYQHDQSAIAFPDAVYALDLEHRTVRRIFSAAPGDTVLIAAGMTKPTKVGRHDHFAGVVATTRAVYVLNPDGSTQIAAPRDSSTAGYGGVTVRRATLAPDQPTVFWYTPAGGTLPLRQGQSRRDVIVSIGASDTAALRRITLPPPVARPKQPTDWVSKIGSAVVTPLPVPIWSAIRRRLSEGSPNSAGPNSVGTVGLSSSEYDFVVAESSAPEHDRIDWLLFLTGGLLSAAIAFGLGRHHALSEKRRRLWVATAFLLGPAGALLMITMLDWPVREPCPVCGKKRVVTNPRCEHCGAEFSAPTKDGTEIFEVVPA